MKTFLLILGVALLVIGAQDAIRILVDSNNTSLFGWVAGGTPVYVTIDGVLVVAGLLVAGMGSRMKERKK